MTKDEAKEIYIAGFMASGEGFNGVVDLNRWQYSEDPQGDSLNDEWEPVK